MKKSFLFFWLGIVALVGFFWIYFPTLSRYRDLKLEEETLSRDLNELDVKIDDLKEERNLLKNDAEYMEKVIRQELGLVRPGETVYKFVEEEIKKPEPPAPPEPPVEELPEPAKTEVKPAPEIIQEPAEIEVEPEPEIDIEEAEPVVIPEADESEADSILATEEILRQTKALPAVSPYALSPAPVRSAKAPLTPKIPKKPPSLSANTKPKPRAITQVIPVKPKPAPLRKPPAAKLALEEDSFDEEESIWDRFAEKVSDVVSEIRDEWMPEDEPHAFPPLPSQRRSPPKQTAPLSP